MGTLAPIIQSLGIQPYLPVYERMLCFQAQRDEHSPDEIWLLEHEPVYTLGRNGKEEHILNAQGIPVVHIDRGGQVTYHGPGQLIVYTLIDLKRARTGIKQWVNTLENSVITLLDGFGISAYSDPDAPGVYVDGAKIAALGLRVSRGRCYHGLSLNVDMDLQPFENINPCGYAGLPVTQCSDLGITASMEEISQLLLESGLCAQGMSENLV